MKTYKMPDGSQLTRDGLHESYKVKMREILRLFMDVIIEAATDCPHMLADKDAFIKAFVEGAFTKASEDKFMEKFEENK